MYLTSLGPDLLICVLEYCSDILFTTMCKGPYNSLSAFLCIWPKWHALSSCWFKANIFTLLLPLFSCWNFIFFFTWRYRKLTQIENGGGKLFIPRLKAALLPDTIHHSVCHFCPGKVLSRLVWLEQMLWLLPPSPHRLLLLSLQLHP